MSTSTRAGLVARTIATPTGPLRLVASDRGVRLIDWHTDREPAPDGAHPLLDAAEAQLAEYFDGRRTSFDLPLDPAGTPFQVSVWRALADIPFGETTTYGELAARLGRAGSARAIGGAVGRNPLVIVLPCHRVVGADGSLTGFGGGLPNKRLLLRIEGNDIDEDALQLSFDS